MFLGQRSCNVRAVGLSIPVKTAKSKVNTHHICCGCRRQFIDIYEPKGYSDEIKRECLEMYVNGMGFRAIERVKKVHHTTVINWVKPNFSRYLLGGAITPDPAVPKPDSLIAYCH